MIPATHAAHSIQTTAATLQDELGRLEIQKQALERELAAVVAHLGSVQQALSALQVLLNDPRPAPSDSAPVAVPATRDDATATSRTRAPQSAAGQKAAAPDPASPSAEADAQSTYGRITDQIMEYFDGIGGADVRARDVAAALGRDTDNGSINAVRSTLDRLVGASRLERAGRGLYRAKSA